MAITAAMHSQVSQLYVALFGRAPANEGLGYWAQELSIGTPLSQVANEMFATTEARHYYPSLSTNDQIITSFFTNVLGRPPATGGLNYWVGEFNKPTASVGSVINDMIASVTSYVAGSNPDHAIDALGVTSAALFANKEAVALHFGLSTGSVALANLALTGVTTDPASVAIVEAANDAAIAAAVGTSFTLTTANDLFLGGTGADTFSGTFSDGGTNTFNTGDTLTGGAGTDTLNINPNIEATALTLSDAFWTNVSGIENIVIGTTTGGVQTLVTNDLFNTAFSAGVNLTTTSTGGAINITMGGAVTETVTITTTSTDGSQTINTGTGGAGTATVNATSTAGGLTISGGDLVSVTTHSTDGIQNIDSTGTAAVTVNATSTSGAQTIATGAGNDSITVSSTAIGATINAGGGKDAITLGVADTTIQAITVTPGDSVQTAFDTVTNFGIGTGSGSDTLALGSTTLLTNAADTLTLWIVTAGIATKTGSVLSDFLLAATTATTAGVVAYYDIAGGNTYIVASDGLASGASDTVVELVGVTTVTAVAGAAATTTIHIV